ncbi:tyrosine-type recombinase/integrase [Arcanobacterium haemolyticum]
MDTIKEFRAHLEARKVSCKTIDLRVYYLKRINRSVDLLSCDVPSIEYWLSGQSWKIETARSVATTLRVFYQWLYKTGKIGTDISEQIPKIREELPHPHPLPDQEYLDVIASADARIRLAVRLAGEAGLRRSEVAQIHQRDLFKDFLGYSLRVHGKGGKERTVPLNKSLGIEIKQTLRLNGGGFLFPSRASSGHITADYLGRCVSSILPEGWSMHSLRHRFATACYTRTHDIRAVQELLGHSTVATTQRYVAIDSDRLRAVASTAAA